MTAQQTAYQRMLDWCQAATQQTVIPGTRTISRHPEAPDPERWQGTIDAEAFRDMRWKGPHIESVIKQMDTACGTRPEADYILTE